MGVPTETSYVPATTVAMTDPGKTASTTVEEPAPTPSTTWPEGVKFTHFRDTLVDTKRGIQVANITACYRFVDQDDIRIMELGFAFCAPSDMFSRKVGRELAYDRMTTDPYAVPLRSSRHTRSPVEIIDDVLHFAIGVRSDLPGMPNSWLTYIGPDPTLAFPSLVL